jgi:aldose 1-epimerase
VRYSLSADRLLVSLEGVSDLATPLNLANHAYYNLAGHGAGADELYEHRQKATLF